MQAWLKYAWSKSQFPVAYLTLVPARYHGRSPSKACCQFPRYQFWQTRKSWSQIGTQRSNLVLKPCILSTAREWKNYCARARMQVNHVEPRQPTCSNRWSFISTSIFSNSWSSRDQQPKLKQSQQDNQRPRQFDSLWDPLRPAWIEIMFGFIRGSALVNRPSCSVPSGFLGTSFCAPSVLSLVNLRFHLQGNGIKAPVVGNHGNPS